MYHMYKLWSGMSRLLDTTKKKLVHMLVIVAETISSLIRFFQPAPLIIINFISVMLKRLYGHEMSVLSSIRAAALRRLNRIIFNIIQLAYWLPPHTRTPNTVRARWQQSLFKWLPAISLAFVLFRLNSPQVTQICLYRVLENSE